MTRLRFTAWCKASARQAIPARFEREIDQFTLLSRDSVRNLLNAASIAGLLLTTECAVTDIPEKKGAPAGGGGMGGMGGMDMM